MMTHTKHWLSIVFWLIFGRCTTDFTVADTATDSEIEDPVIEDREDTNGETDVVCPTAVWYYDEDGDGYGTNDVYVCVEDAPEGYASVSGDCCDINPDVRPNQSGFFEVPYTCPNISFDYNCDGAATKEYALELCPDLEATCTAQGTEENCLAISCCFFVSDPDMPSVACGDEVVVWRCGWTYYDECSLNVNDNGGCPAYNGGGEQFIQCR